MQRFRNSSREHPSTVCLARAISNIDRRLEEVRVGGQPIPLNAYRARRILQEAKERCSARGASETFPFRPEQARQTDGASPHERPQDLAASTARPPAADLHIRACDHAVNAHGGKTMAYDWTGAATRRRNRLKLAAAILLGIAIVAGVPVALAPF